MEIGTLYENIQKGKAKLVGHDGETRALPGSLHSFLEEVSGILNDGKSVHIVQSQLTTVQAATMLGVSRQFLVNLLEKGEIPFHLVGTHRRMYSEDVLQYKMKRDNRVIA